MFAIHLENHILAKEKSVPLLLLWNTTNLYIILITKHGYVSQICQEDDKFGKQIL